MQNRDVRRAWEAFHQDGLVPGLVRPAIVASWRRSKQHQIAVSRPEAALVTDAEFHRRRQQHGMFLHAARPAMERAREFLAEANSMAVLTDPTRIILETGGDERAVDFGSVVKLQRGGRWGEAEFGTNAISTAIASVAPVQIHAAEHFCSEVQKWTRAAAPVRHPLSGEVVGVLDISGPADSFSPQSLAHAVAMAHQVEATLGRQIDGEHDRVLRHFLRKRPLWLTEEVVAFGRNGALIYASEKALCEIERRSPRLLVKGGMGFVQDVEPALWASRCAALLQGASLEAVMEDGQAIGGVLVLHALRCAKPAPKPSEQEGAGRFSFDAILGDSPAIFDARDKARRMAESGAPVLLEGETGVGKELFARAIHGVRGRAIHPGQLRRASEGPHGQRGVRLRQKRLHRRRHGRAAGKDRGCGRWDAVPR